MKNIFEIMNDVNCLIGTGNFEHAAERFLEVLQVSPDFAWNSLWGQTPWAFYEQLVAFFQADFENIHVRSRIACINTLLNRDMNKDALALIPKLESILPGDPLTLEMYARAHAGLGHFYTALQYAERIEAATPDTGEYFDAEYSPRQANPLQLFKLWCYFELGEDDEFEALIGELIASNPNQSDLYLHKSFWLRDRGRYQEGLAAAEKALSLRRSSIAWFQKGWFNRILNPNAAIQDFKAFFTAPPSPESSYYSPFVYTYIGQVALARRSMMDYLSKYPNDSNAIYLCSEIYSLLGESEMAIDCLKQAIKKGLVSRAGLYADPALKSVRETPDGKELIMNHLRTLEREDMRAAREISYC